MKLHPNIQAYLPVLQRHRRFLHRIPEEGLQEHNTQSYLMDILSESDPDVLEPCADTGVRAVFFAKEPRRTLAFRADMDALCIQEENKHDFVSHHPGMMHACGHDGHMSMLLTLARLIGIHRSMLRDHVVLLFQPAEESVGGAKRMIEAGALKNPDVDAIYALHMMPDLPIGTLGTKAGPLMASTCEFDIDLLGKAAHGAMPHLGADAILAAAHLIEMLQSLVARQIDPYEQALITVGHLAAGERRNVLADKAKLECTMRAFSDDTMRSLRAHIAKDLRALEIAFDVKGRYTEIVHYPVVNNHSAETDRVLSVLGDQVRLVAPKMIAEDFSFFQQEIPGVYLFLGCEDALYHQPLHSPLFDFDEAALLYGLNAYAQLINWQGAPWQTHPE